MVENVKDKEFKSLVSQQELEQAELQSMLVNDKLEIASNWLEFNN